MKRGEAFPSQYLSKEEVAIPLTAIIAGVQLGTLKNEDGGEDHKPVMSFQGDIKPMILNNTNWMVLEDLYGPDSDDWAGKPIELYLDPSVMFGNKRVGGVRVRPSQARLAFKAWPDVVKYCFDNGGIDEQTVKDHLREHLRLQGHDKILLSRDSDEIYRFVDATLEELNSVPLE